jgi:hypothetical protein
MHVQLAHATVISCESYDLGYQDAPIVHPKSKGFLGCLSIQTLVNGSRTSVSRRLRLLRHCGEVATAMVYRSHENGQI